MGHARGICVGQRLQRTVHHDGARAVGDEVDVAGRVCEGALSDRAAFVGAATAASSRLRLRSCQSQATTCQRRPSLMVSITSLMSAAIASAQTVVSSPSPAPCINSTTPSPSRVTGHWPTSVAGKQPAWMSADLASPLRPRTNRRPSSPSPPPRDFGEQASFASTHVVVVMRAQWQSRGSTATRGCAAVIHVGAETFVSAIGAQRSHCT